MKTRDLTYKALLGLLFAAFPLLAATQELARVVKPEIRVGDSWTYRSTNVFAPGTHEHEIRVSYADAKAILAVSTRKSDGKEFDSSWTPEWNAVTSYTGFVYRPHSGLLRFPLRIGDTYEVKFEFLRPRENTILNTNTGTAKVVGWDMVSVPAGTFRAIKVVIETVTSQVDGSRAGQPQFTFWYAPEVRRWVKLQVVGPKFPISEELLAYKLNED